jgi:indole-3-glycerol phosphate synthase
VILDQIVRNRRPAVFAPIESEPRPLQLRPGLTVIAEFKRKSPSAGMIRADADPARVARAYEKAGAAAISVLTDREFFDGDPAHLQLARAHVKIPVLRKDFLLSEDDVRDSRRMGADVILLIVRILDDARLCAMHALAKELKMAALVETHSEHEIDRALAAGAEIIGVNHRDLDTLEVDLSLSARAREKIGDKILVAESGIKTRADVQRMREHGADAILVGESLMKAADPGHALVELCS